MTDQQAKMVKQLSKLPLEEVTMIIDDIDLRMAFSRGEELLRCWTMKQKQDFSKKLRDVLLG